MIGGGGGRSSSYQESTPQNGGEFEEYDAGEWESSDRPHSSSAPARAHSTSSRTSTQHRTTKATPPTPKSPLPTIAKAKVPEVNLFDFDDDEQTATPPTPVSKGSDTGFGKFGGDGQSFPFLPFAISDLYVQQTTLTTSNPDPTAPPLSRLPSPPRQ